MHQPLPKPAVANNLAMPLKSLKLDDMVEAFTEMQSQDGSADLTHAEWLGLLIDRGDIQPRDKTV